LIETVSGVKSSHADNDKVILENNIFGVDINEESIEIAKLSLWLRTAKRGRLLSDLSNNIKCGNSLIDDKTVDKEKAFNWHKEFPQVFGEQAQEQEPEQNVVITKEVKPDYLEMIEQNARLALEKAKLAAELSNEALEYSKKVYEYVELQQLTAGEPEIQYGISKGGFDVVIGNPPYGVKFSEIEKKYLTRFDTLVPDYEIYIYFISLATDKLLKTHGKLGYIFPNTFLSILYGKNYREKLINNFTINEIVDLSEDRTFVDASVRTCIFNLTKSFNNESKVEFKKISDNNSKTVELIHAFDKSVLEENLDNWLSISSVSTNFLAILNRIKNNAVVNDFFEVSQGYIPYRRSDLIKTFGEQGNAIVDERLWHSDVKLDSDYKQEILGKNLFRYYNTESESYVKYGKHLASYVPPKFFEYPRVLIREITSQTLNCNYLEKQLYNNPSIINVINEKNLLHLKFLLTILNSKLIGWYHNNVSPKAKKGLFPKILINDVRNIPIKAISKEAQKPFIEKADQMLCLNKALHEHAGKFTRNLQREFGLESLTKKLENWYGLSYADFLKELEKQKIKLSLNKKAEWEDYFITESKLVKEISATINQTDQEIDRMVYELYELTLEEIEVVENSIL